MKTNKSAKMVLICQKRRRGDIKTIGKIFARRLCTFDGTFPLPPVQSQQRLCLVPWQMAGAT